MSKKKLSRSAGFILPLSLGFLMLVALWGSLLLEHMFTQTQHIEKSWQEQSLFYLAQDHLEKCVEQIGLSKIFEGCCYIEDLSDHLSKPLKRATTKKYYRISVQHALTHQTSSSSVKALNDDLLSTVRLQASIQWDPATNTKLSYHWREIFDLNWEKQLYQQQILSKDFPSSEWIWEKLPICTHSN